MKKIIAFVAFFVIAIIGYIAAGPFITLHQITLGVQQQDSEKLSKYIDFPTLRSNLKEQLNAFVTKEALSESKDKALVWQNWTVT